MKKQLLNICSLEIQVNKTTRSYDKNRGKLNSLRAELDKAGFNTNKLASEQEKLAQKIQKTGSAYSKLSSSQKLAQAKERHRGKVGSATSELGGAMAPVLASAAAMANPLRFEHELARVYSLSNANKDEKAFLSETFKGIAEDYATTSVNAVKTGGVYGQAGFDAKQIKGIMPSTFNVAEATRSDAELVANLMGNFKTAFKMDASNETEMGYLANLLTKGSNTSKASIESLTESSKYLLDKPSNLKISASETMAYLATVGDFGLLDSMAGTSFGQLMERLAKKDVQQKLVSAGINPFKIDEKSNQKVLQTPHEIAQQWAKRFEGIDSNNEQLQALQAEIFQTQAWQFMGPLVSGVKSGKLNEYMAKYDRKKLEKGNEKDYAKKKREEMQDTAWGQSVQVLSKLDKASLETFGPMEENIKGVAISIQELIGSYTDFVSKDENKQLVQNVIKTTGALVGLNVGLKASKLAFALVKNPLVSSYEGYETLRKGVDFLSKSQRISTAWTIASNRATAAWTFTTGIASKAASFFRLQNLKNIAVLGVSKAASLASSAATGIATGAQWAWNVALNANPIGLVVTGVAALAAGGIWLYNNWKRIPEIFSKSWDSIASIFTFWKNEKDLEKVVSVDTSKAEDDLNQLKQDNVVSLNFTPEAFTNQQQIIGEKPDNIVDITDRLKKLESQQYEKIPGNNNDNSSTSLTKNFSDNRKIVIQNLTIENNHKESHLNDKNSVAGQFQEIISHNWGPVLYDAGEVINGVG